MLFLSIFILYRSPVFHNFIKVALTKNPKKRPTADKLIEVRYLSLAQYSFPGLRSLGTLHITKLL
jgi:serine/threonine protein kinase